MVEEQGDYTTFSPGGQVTGLGQWVIAGTRVLLLQLVRDLLDAQNL